MKNLSTMYSQQKDSLEELVTQVADEFIKKMESGQDPSIEDYAKQHPEAAGIIRRTLGALKTMRSVDLWEVGLDDNPNVDNRPRTIGDFRLIRVVGRGGMGIVYEAEQLSLHRPVALKVLPFAAMLDERALKRFRNEVTAAAQLDHPNIVPVHGVGCDRGVHHYAMRLVEGVTLAEIIDQLRDLRDHDQAFPDSIGSMGSSTPFGQMMSDTEHALSNNKSKISCELAKDTAIDQDDRTTRSAQSWKNVRQPATHFRSVAMLVATVAGALDHAHHQGVIHRDVKPSNLMIDGSGKPWVTDFGLAHLETGAALTMTGDLLGTAHYMSPDQLMAKPVILDHRTDIYSLGVTLYELLTLELPFDTESRQELFRQIMSDEPRRPRKINPAIPHDLETIVLKAIEKNPADRYQTSQELADDLQRFVAGESILSFRSSPLQRVAKLIRRRPAIAATIAIAAVFCSIALGVFAVLQQVEKTKTQGANRALNATNRSLTERNQELEEARSELVAAQEVAQSERDVALAINNFLLDDLLSLASPANQPDRDITLKTVIDFAARVLETRFSNQPAVRASVHQVIGDVYHQLGEFTLAEKHLKKTIEIRERVLGSLDVETLKSRQILGALYLDLARLEEAENLITDVVAKCQRALGHDHVGTLTVLGDLASLHSAKGNHQKALELNQKVVAACRENFGADHSATIESEMLLGHELTLLGKYEESRRIIARALQSMQRVYGDEHPTTLKAKIHLSDTLTGLGRSGEAVELLEDALKTSKRVVGDRHPYSLDMMQGLGKALMSDNRLREAESMFREVLFGGDEEPNWDLHFIWGTANNLGLNLIYQNKPEEAEALLRKSLATSKRIHGVGHVETIIAGINLGIALRDQNRLDASIQVLQETVDAADNSLGQNHHNTVIARNHLGRNCWLAERYDEAADVFREQLKIMTRERDPDDSETVMAKFNLATNLNESGQLEEALLVMEQLHQMGPSLPAAYMPTVMRSLIDIYTTTERHEQAVTLILANVEAARSEIDPGSAEYAVLLAVRAMQLMELDAFEQAEIILREFLDIRRVTAPDKWVLFNAKSMLGHSLTGQGAYGEAEPLLIEGYQGMKAHEESIPDGAKGRLTEARDRLLTLYILWGKPEEAQRWRSK